MNIYEYMNVFLDKCLFFFWINEFLPTLNAAFFALPLIPLKMVKGLGLPGLNISEERPTGFVVSMSQQGKIRCKKPSKL